MTTLSILIPTCGRPSLAGAVRSAASQLEDGDEILIRHDSNAAWGNASRDRLTRQAQGDYLLFLDDDDRYISGALDMVRAELDHDPGRIHVFRMVSDHDGEVWRAKEVMPGNVGTPMIAVPNQPDLPSWAQSATHTSDFDFILRLVQDHGEPVWHEQVIVEVRPQNLL